MWRLEYTKRFLKDLAALPNTVKDRAEAIAFQELNTDDPFSLGYIEKLAGYTDKYKIRIGEYRIGLTLNTKEQTIICQRIAHRREIYRIFP
jgi:mRNA interferase RelE/StbE